MRRMIENCFESVESNVGSALFALVLSFAITGCVRLLWE
jgi:hypothetical protein